MDASEGTEVLPAHSLQGNAAYRLGGMQPTGLTLLKGERRPPPSVARLCGTRDLQVETTLPTIR